MRLTPTLTFSLYYMCIALCILSSVSGGARADSLGKFLKVCLSEVSSLPYGYKLADILDPLWSKASSQTSLSAKEKRVLEELAEKVDLKKIEDDVFKAKSKDGSGFVEASFSRHYRGMNLKVSIEEYLQCIVSGPFCHFLGSHNFTKNLELLQKQGLSHEASQRLAQVISLRQSQKDLELAENAQAYKAAAVHRTLIYVDPSTKVSNDVFVTGHGSLAKHYANRDYDPLSESLKVIVDIDGEGVRAASVRDWSDISESIIFGAVPTNSINGVFLQTSKDTPYFFFEPIVENGTISAFKVSPTEVPEDVTKQPRGSSTHVRAFTDRAKILKVSSLESIQEFLTGF